MPRPRRFRKVWRGPYIDYFKPTGIRVAELEESVLTVDEFEAIRLKDLLGIEEKIAAEKMNISQPTFNRLILSARKKIADAIINGKAIRIEGGAYKMVQPIRGGMRRRMRRGFGGAPISCICPSCGYEEAKKAGVPCASLTCPKCKSPMTRG